MWYSDDESHHDAVACPFCGLICDDLRLAVEHGRLQQLENGCHLAEQAYQAAFQEHPGGIAINGRPGSLQQALEACSGLLQQADAPLFAGLATDVNGMRGVLQLAERCAAHLDHASGDALFRNLRVLQDSGWFTTTFGEVRNRADLILLLGKECVARFPRLVERVLLPDEALFSPAQKRRLVLVGPWADAPLPPRLAALEPLVIPLEVSRLGAFSNLLRGLLAGRPLDGGALGDAVQTRLPALLDGLRTARYSVLCWSAAELAFPHAELTVDALVQLVRDLNRERRAAALPLSGTLGDQTANQVCTWQTGYPLRTSLQRGYPQHDPVLQRHQDLLERREIDLLLWISALSAQMPPPETSVPRIVLGHPAMTFDPPPAVFIPVGTPGIDHAGHLYRSDATTVLPVGRLRESGLPSVASVVGALHRRLAGETQAEGKAC